MTKFRIAWKIGKRLTYVAAGLGGAFGTFLLVEEIRFRKRQNLIKIALADTNLNARPTTPLPSRAEILKNLQTEEFDLLVIGGGATGAGIALDAQTRGLQTALVEMDDFSSGTSSRSTKLIHGGVRYLQSAILKLDLEQYRMVKEALFERANLLEIAPHVSSPLPIMLPLYKLWQIPYYYAGIKMYDLVSGKRLLKSSYYINKSKTLDLFPMLKKDSLVGALIYYDGQHNDSRMNLAIILSAIRKGAQCSNHVAVVNLLKRKDETSGGKEIICGARVKDMLTGIEWDMKAKAVVNATGAYCDMVRIMDDPKAEKLVIPSQGVHIVLPGYYSPRNTGLLDPNTSDGRVIFFLPWEGMTVAGTTDSPCEITHSPAPNEKDVDFILKEIRNYLDQDISVRRGDVLSAWAGLRPLVKDPSKKDTKSIARNHIIVVSDSKLITIAGGKWTTYRCMAEQTVDRAVKELNLPVKGPCVTPGLFLEGGHEYTDLMYMRLVQDYGLDVDVAIHLARTYGDRAFSVAKMAKLTGKRWPIVGVKLHGEFPYLESEILYSMKEYACTAIDVVARRLRLAFLNTYAAEEALPRIVEIMAAELKWDKKECERQLQSAKKFIEIEMGKQVKQRAIADAPLNLTKAEKEKAISRFKALDNDKKGFITVNDLRRYFINKGEKLDERLLHDLLGEVDLVKNGEMALIEFLQLYSGIKAGYVAQSRLVSYLEELPEGPRRISPERSGGGL